MGITWDCHICKQVRPDAKISVLTRPLMIKGMPMGEQNIRHCNDNDVCPEKAKSWSFVEG